MPRKFAGCYNTVVASYTVTHKRAVVYDSYGYPRTGVMTGVTLGGGGDVARPFTGGDHTVVTARTGSYDLAVIHGTGSHRCPLRRKLLVAGITQGSRADVLGAFARGGDAIVAVDTVPDKARVIHRGRHPLAGAVAGVALLIRDNVRRVFAGRNHVVVAARAHPKDFGMIHTQGHRVKRSRTGGMTGLAGVTAKNMVSGLANGNDIVVTAGAGANDLAVVHRTGRHRGPLGREFLMAGVTDITAADVACALAAGIHPVVTGAAIARKAGVVHRRRHPLAGAVAGVTFLVGNQMRRVLARGRDAVVTARTVAQHLAMVNLDDRNPGGWRRRVTGVTQVGGGHVGTGFATADEVVVAVGTGAHHLVVIHLGER